MHTSNICGESITEGTGKMFVKKDGKVFWFCSNKCEKNMLVLKRKPRKIKWTKEFHDIKKGVKQ